MNRRHHPGLSWPQIHPDPIQVACNFCDTLQIAPRLRENEAAQCCTCGEILFRNRPRSLSRASSFSIAALVLMLMTHAFPFMSFTSTNITTRLNLAGAAEQMIQIQQPLLALALVFFTIIAPSILVGGLLYIVIPLQTGHSLPGVVHVARWIQKLQPWNMLEVFLLGVLVSLLKLGKLAALEFDIGFWSLIGLIFCTSLARGGIDNLELWDRIEISELPKKNDSKSLQNSLQL